MEYAVKMEGICKSFSGVQVLDHVDFALELGKIHAIVGENGAGKSTLIKILSGAYSKDSGEIWLEGMHAYINSPIDSKMLGIQCIYQELSLVPHLSVANNIYLCKESTKLGFINQRKINKDAQNMLNSLELNIDARTETRYLGIGEQFFTEICRCLVGNAKIVIMDEPTSAMTPNEYTQFLKMIDLLKKRKISVIYISHRLDEIFEICDYVTVMRDGKVVTTCSTKDISLPAMIHQMIGKEVSGHLQRVNEKDLSDAGIALCIKNLSTKKLHNISLELKKGEVLGVTGLLGAGKTELANVIFGIDKPIEGVIEISGKPSFLKHPIDSMNHDLALVPENRKKHGLFQDFSIKENIAIVNLNKMTKRKIFVDKKKETIFSSEKVKEFKVKCNNVKQGVRFLSGGNQQKVVLAKWIARTPKVLLLDEPTRGIDVGSKEEVYGVICNMAKKGVGIILFSSEMPEVIALSDRIIVLHDGEIKGEIPGGKATQENILLMAAGEKI